MLIQFVVGIVNKLVGGFERVTPKHNVVTHPLTWENYSLVEVHVISVDDDNTTRGTLKTPQWDGILLEVSRNEYDVMLRQLLNHYVHLPLTCCETIYIHRVHCFLLCLAPLIERLKPSLHIYIRCLPSRYLGNCCSIASLASQQGSQKQQICLLELHNSNK